MAKKHLYKAKASLFKPPKTLLFLLCLWLILFLGGCNGASSDSAGKITPPSRQGYPLTGQWVVLEELDSNDSGKEGSTWVGTKVQFASEALALGEQIWDQLSYKVKRVKAEAYLASKYLSFENFPLQKGEKVEVITIYAAANYLGECMKLDDQKMLFFGQNKILALQKVSDEVNPDFSLSEGKAQQANLKDITGSSGILLGLRLQEDEGYTYETLWIAVEQQRELHPVLVAENLFFPRTSGFWEVIIQDLATEGKKGNYLTAQSIPAKISESQKTEQNTATVTGIEAGAHEATGTVTGKGTEIGNAVIEKNMAENFVEHEPSEQIIHYLGNDYIALEKKVAGVSKLQLLPVDKLSSPTVINVSDILGDNGALTYFNAREQAVEGLKKQGIYSIERDAYGENFGLARKNGHWFLVGRVNYQKNGVFEYSDFELKTAPPSSLIVYDTLTLSWYHIKDRVPDALDAFTSPNKDIALVKTKNKLTIYPIGTEQLGETPLAELDLPEGAAIVMAEWATGSYVDSWEKSFLAYGAQALDNNSVRIWDKES